MSLIHSPVSVLSIFYSYIYLSYLSISDDDDVFLSFFVLFLNIESFKLTFILLLKSNYLVRKSSILNLLF